MKRFIFLLVVLILALIGCDETDDLSGEKVEGAALVDSDAGCCWRSWAVSGWVHSTTVDDMYFVLELRDEDQNARIAMSPVPVVVSGLAQKMVDLELVVSALDQIDAGDYSLAIYGYNVIDLPNLKKRAIVEAIDLVYIPNWFDSSCYDCCLPEYNHAELRLAFPELITGASGKITTRYGLPCDYPNGNLYAHGIAQVSIVAEGLTSLNEEDIWCQIGIGYSRGDSHYQGGETNIAKHVYIESIGDKGWLLKQFYLDFEESNPDGIDPPMDGDVAEVAVLIDTLTGNVGFWYQTDSLPWSFQQDIWQVWVCCCARFGGEIKNYDDDMPGSFSQPCVIEDLKCRVVGDLNLTPVDYHDRWPELINTNVNQWSVDTLSTTHVIFWDNDRN